MSSKNCIWLLEEGDPRKEEEVYSFLLEFYKDSSKRAYPKWFLEKSASFFAKRKTKDLIAVYNEIQRYGVVWDETLNLAKRIEKHFNGNIKVFVGMRYFGEDLQKTAKEIANEKFETTVLLPLFPQESDAFTTPCLLEAEKALIKEGFKGRIFKVRRFYDEPDFIDAISDSIKAARATSKENSRVILVGRTLPKKIAAKDNYYNELKETLKLIGEKVNVPFSLVRPSQFAWQEGILAFSDEYLFSNRLEPSVEDVIEEWGKGGCKSVVAAPISSTIENRETLFYLDVMCKKIAESYQMEFIRVKAASSHSKFIQCASKLGENFFNEKGI